MVGRGIYNLFRKALPPEAVNEENVQKMADRFLPYYGAHNCDFTRPYAGVTDVLEHLHARGVALAVASNKPRTNTRKAPSTSSVTSSATCLSRPSWANGKASPSNRTRPSWTWPHRSFPASTGDKLSM